MKIYYKDGIHIEVNHSHILVDPSTNENSYIERVSYEEYVKIVNKRQKEYNSVFEHISFILLTHAHTDHCDLIPYFKDRKLSIIAHPYTIRFRSTWFREIDPKLVIPANDYQNINVNGFNISVLPSGHCAGSVMYYIETQDGNVLLTGDYNTQQSMILFPADIKKCDYLISEATFGKQEYSFPPRISVYNDIYTYFATKFNIKRDSNAKTHPVVLLFGRGIGTIQDILGLCSTFASLRLRLLVDPYSYKASKLFETVYNRSFDKYELKSTTLRPLPQTVILNGYQYCKAADIDILIKEFGLEANPPILILTGWAKEDTNDEEIQLIQDTYSDVTLLPLSNHIGFDGIIQFIQECDPQKIGFFHGWSKDMAHTLRGLGYEAFDLHTEICE